MKLRPKGIIGILKGTAQEWSDDKVPRLGAALAYYTIFSIAPLLIIAITIVGMLFGEEAAKGQIEAEMGRLIGSQGAGALQDMIQNAGEKKSHGIVASIIGFVVLLLGASGVFVQLKDALNTIWEVPEKKQPGGIMGFIKTRFLSFGLVLGIGFLLMASLVLSTALAALGKFASGIIPVSWLMQLVNFAVSFGVITVLFAMIFKYLPDIELRWKDVWFGAAATALLFAIGKWLIGLYLGKSSVTSAYGAAGSLVILLIWIYYSAQILFFGAELTQVYTRNYGSLYKPETAEDQKKIEEKEAAGLAAGDEDSEDSEDSEDEKKKETADKKSDKSKAVSKPAVAEATSSDKKQRTEKDLSKDTKSKKTDAGKQQHAGRPASEHVPAFATKPSPVAGAAAKGLSYLIVGMLGLNTAKRAVGISPGEDDLPRR